MRDHSYRTRAKDLTETVMSKALLVMILSSLAACGPSQHATGPTGDASARAVDAGGHAPEAGGAGGINMSDATSAVGDSASDAAASDEATASDEAAASDTSTGSQESPNCTVLSSTTGSIRDAQGNVWTLVQSSANGLEIYENGTYSNLTMSVTQLVYVGHVVSQENVNDDWWSWTSGAWVSETDPTGICSGDAGDASADAPATGPYPLEATTTITGCDNTGTQDVTACIGNFISNHAGPGFYLGAGTYKISGQIIIVSKRLYGNNSTSSPTKLVAASGAEQTAMQLEGISSGVDWIELDAYNNGTRQGAPAYDCINVDGATGTAAKPVFITNSTFKDCASAGIFNNDWDKGPSNWVVLAANHVVHSLADCAHSSTYGNTPIKNLLVEYNLLEQCGDDGVPVGAYTSSNPTTNVVIQYNTVHNQNWAQGVSEWVPCSPVGSCIVRNNYIYQDVGYVSPLTGTDSGPCIMLEAAGGYGGIGPVGWINEQNDCINRGISGHGNYMMWNGASYAAFGNNSFTGNTSKDAHFDCINLTGGPQMNEMVTNNVCANPGGMVVNDGTGGAIQSGNQSISDSAYHSINAPGGGPGTDPAYR
jgi:hypothetical protein